MTTKFSTVRKQLIRTLRDQIKDLAEQQVQRRVAANALSGPEKHKADLERSQWSLVIRYKLLAYAILRERPINMQETPNSQGRWWAVQFARRTMEKLCTPEGQKEPDWNWSGFQLDYLAWSRLTVWAETYPDPLIPLEAEPTAQAAQ
jgi:hypothetical protein